jgi:hypothetical protein
MALYTVANGAGARSLDIDQIVQLLTGSMPDQPVTIGQLLTITGGNLSLHPLLSPTISSYSVGGSGAATASYYIVANNGVKDATPGPTLNATAIPAQGALGGAVYVQVNWAPAVGASSYKIVKQISSVWTQIGTVTAVQGQTTSYSFQDKGVQIGAYTPTVYSPGGQIQGGITPIGFLVTPYAPTVISAAPQIGGVPFLFQAGSYVVTTSSVGAFSIPLPQTFPNGVSAAILTPGSSPAGLNLQQNALIGGASSIPGIAYVGATPLNTVNIRVNFLIIGW